MTPAQEKYLSEIRISGREVYNGRAWKPLHALRDAGLIELDVQVEPRADGKHVWVLIARATRPTPSEEE